MLILYNDRWVEKEQASVPLFSDAFMFGFGVFETLRANPGGRIIKLEEHISRLNNSAGAIGLKLLYNSNEISEQVQKVALRSKDDYQRIKIIGIAEALIVITEKLVLDPDVYRGVKVISLIQNRALPVVKSLSYLECFLSYKEAQEKGYFEAILLGNEGIVYEGSRSNLFWIKNQEIFTREDGILPGITRDAVLSISPQQIKMKSINISDLKTCDEVFLTGSTLGIVPIVQIDDSIIGTGKPGKLTQYLWELLQTQVYL